MPGLTKTKLFEVAEQSIDEIECLLEGYVDIDNNGNANFAMKTLQELVYIKFVIRQLKAQEELDAITRTKQGD